MLYSGMLIAFSFSLALLLLSPHSASSSLSPSSMHLLLRNKAYSKGTGQLARKRPSPSTTKPVLKAHPSYQTFSLPKKGSKHILSSFRPQRGASQLEKAKEKPRPGDHEYTERPSPVIPEQTQPVSLASKPSEDPASSLDSASTMVSKKQMAEIKAGLDPRSRHVPDAFSKMASKLIQSLTQNASGDSATAPDATLLDHVLIIRNSLEPTVLLWRQIMDTRTKQLPASLAFVYFPYMTALVGLHSDMSAGEFRAFIEALCLKSKEGDSSISMASDYTRFRQLDIRYRRRINGILAMSKKKLVFEKSPRATLPMAALCLKAWDKFAVLLETVSVDENVLIELINLRRIKLLNKALGRSVPSAINRPVAVHGLAIDAAINIPDAKLRPKVVRALLKHGSSFTATHFIASFSDLATLELFCARIRKMYGDKSLGPLFRFHLEDEKMMHEHSLWNYAVEEGRHEAIGVLSKHFGSDMLQVPSPIDGLTPLRRALRSNNEKVIAAVRGALRHAGLSEELPFTIDFSLLCGSGDGTANDTGLGSRSNKPVPIPRSTPSTSGDDRGGDRSAASTASCSSSSLSKCDKTFGEGMSNFASEEGTALSERQQGFPNHKLSCNPSPAAAAISSKKEAVTPKVERQDEHSQARLRYKENMASKHRERMTASASFLARMAASSR